MKQYRNKGFTIVESLIFLAVSGMIFISVALLLSGQLEKSQSKDATNQIESVVRGVLNDVSNGYYPEIGTNFTCDATGGVGVAPIVAPTIMGGTGRGTLQGCILIGKKITFDQNEIKVDTLVAPKGLVAISTNSVFTDVPSLRDVKTYKWRLENTDSHSPSPTYYILNSALGADVVGGGSTSTGAQSVKIYKLASGPSLSWVNSAEKLCFSRDSVNYYALEIAKDGALTADMTFKGASC